MRSILGNILREHTDMSLEVAHSIEMPFLTGTLLWWLAQTRKPYKKLKLLAVMEEITNEYAHSY